MLSQVSNVRQSASATLSDSSISPVNHFQHVNSSHRTQQCPHRHRFSSSFNIFGNYLFIVLIITLYIPSDVHGFIEGIYCGTENCYDVLELVKEKATKEDIQKAYRKLARKFHPDVHRTEEAKETAAQRFRVIASAYEVLRDEESRSEYDYMLENPDEVYHHYYAYFRRRYAPKVDIRIVAVVAITLISAYQYYAAFSRYEAAIDGFLTIPKYRIRATEIAKEEGLLLSDKEAKKKNRGRSKDEIRADEEKILRKVIEEKMDIRGGYAKPSVYDIAWVQLVLLPYTLYKWVVFYCRWIVKFVILKHEYGQDEKEYLIRRYMGISLAEWDQLDDVEREEYMDLELWEKEKFTEWKKEKDAEMKAKLAESASYRRYRRWMKKGGPGQITFMED